MARTAIILVLFLLTGCDILGTGADSKEKGTICRHGHLYGWEYVGHSRPTYPLFDAEGRPKKCQ